MCGEKSKFVELEEKATGNVTFGDASKIQIKGKDTILIRLKDGTYKFISDVYYVPRLKSNILSLRQLMERGYEILMKDRSLWLRDGSANLIAKVMMSKNRIRFMEMPTTKHLKATKGILRYLKGTIDFGLFYSSSKEFQLVEYWDSDFAGDLDDRKSTTGFVFFMGSNTISWSSKKQAIVTLSSCEAEYVAITACTCHAI
ncbi:hypothetical protein MLD38_031808 [Melastoma candidum]|uniref:Uncharacterized protein n=1 Tax=Melastoma candidum TaxID=119954 RepID=A0ACB9MQE6_9MYRT|nr:hypothetical protein MLD38_031808 [Melastoma candidum]